MRQEFEKAQGAGDHKVLDGRFTAVQRRNTRAHRFHQTIVIYLLVFGRGKNFFFRDQALGAHHLLQSLHLKDGLDAGGFVYHNIHCIAYGLGRRRIAADHFDAYGRHNILPSFAQQTDSAVKVKQNMLYLAAFDIVNEFYFRSGDKVARHAQYSLNTLG